VTVRVAQPILPVPDFPTLKWEQCAPAYVCLKEPDANLLNKFLDKWNAYRHALQRMLEDRTIVQ
jgi:hypothetical protein